jgi:hypothetical protein
MNLHFFFHSPKDFVFLPLCVHQTCSGGPTDPTIMWLCSHVNYAGTVQLNSTVVRDPVFYFIDLVHWSRKMLYIYNECFHYLGVRFVPWSSFLSASECSPGYGVLLFNPGQFMLIITEFTFFMTMFASGVQLTIWCSWYFLFT